MMQGERSFLPAPTFRRGKPPTPPAAKKKNSREFSGIIMTMVITGQNQNRRMMSPAMFTKNVKGLVSAGFYHTKRIGIYE